ncbi:MAG: DUF1922 domain-containing protein [Candidatus Bathyarchaeum sp.]|nr:MAG: DUF1922 domain-containing protein [Candidatus Bathyarchaeum sp.]
MYLVFVCYSCGRFLLAKSDQKTKSCPYCAARLVLIKAKKVAYIKTAQQASEYIRVLKNKRNV